MADVEEQDIDRLLANPPEKVEIEVKYKIAVTVMELRFWLKDCELPNIIMWCLGNWWNNRKCN